MSIAYHENKATPPALENATMITPNRHPPPLIPSSYSNEPKGATTMKRMLEIEFLLDNAKT